MKQAAKEIAPGIVLDPEVRGGKPVVKGTRVPVTVVLEQQSLGASVEEAAEEYGLQREDVLSVLRYAHAVLSDEEVRIV